jgi:TolB-like protein/DNA-binding winged helix-turn-helix (wHTH) protein
MIGAKSLIFRFDDVELRDGEFVLLKAGTALPVEPRAFRVLRHLVENPKRVISKEELLDAVWGDVSVSENSIARAIAQLRRLLGDDPHEPRYIETIPTVGYRFIAALSVEVTGPGSTSETNSTTEVRGVRPKLMYFLAFLGAALAVVALTILSFGPMLVGSHGRVPNRQSPSLSAPPGVKSVAVLPLENLSGEPGQDYLADGLTNELITFLARNSTLRVISAGASMQNVGQRGSLSDLARKIGVDGVLIGSIARSGDRVHMSLQLIEAVSGADLWSETYDRDRGDPLSLPVEAAQQISRRLNRTVFPLPSNRPMSPEAHDAYLHGNYFWFRGQNDRAVPYFKRAIELQPDYAPGWAALSRCYGGSAIMGFASPQEALNRQEQATTKALTLDESLPDAHLVMAATMFQRWNWTRAEQEIVRAIDLDPGFAEAYHFRAIMLAAFDRQREALDAQKRAMDLDPFARPGGMAGAFMLARQYDAALREARLHLEANPQDPVVRKIIFEIYRRQGNQEEAGKVLEQILVASANKTSTSELHTIYGRGGYRALVKWQLNDAKARSATQYVSPYHLAQFEAELGHGQQALALLEEAYRQHAPPLLWIGTDPAFDFLHANERYRAIIRGIGFPSAD